MRAKSDYDLRDRRLPLAHGVGIASYHPSYILRLPDRGRAEHARAALIEDLRRAAEAAQ